MILAVARNEPIGVLLAKWVICKQKYFYWREVEGRVDPIETNTQFFYNIVETIAIYICFGRKADQDTGGVV